jgi:hypothetical protein
VYFCFILSLALCAVEDLHVKLWRVAVIVEDHEKTLMQFMILCKLGPTTPEVYLAVTIIIHL